MNAGDAKPFMSVWSTCSEIQAGRPLGDKVIKAAFKLLIDLELDEITLAITKHCRQSEWMPRPAEIIQLVLGQIPPPSILLELAYADNTMLGKYVRSLISSDLNVLHPKQCENRIAARMTRIEDFYNRALTGVFTSSELRMLIIAQIDPLAPIAPGCPSVRIPFRAALAQRVASTVIPKQIEEATPERTEQDNEAGKAHLAQLMKSMGMGPRAVTSKTQEPLDKHEAFKAQVQTELEGMKTLHRVSS